MSVNKFKRIVKLLLTDFSKEHRFIPIMRHIDIDMVKGFEEAEIKQQIEMRIKTAYKKYYSRMDESKTEKLAHNGFFTEVSEYIKKKRTWIKAFLTLQ